MSSPQSPSPSLHHPSGSCSNETDQISSSSRDALGFLAAIIGGGKEGGERREKEGENKATGTKQKREQKEMEMEMELENMGREYHSLVKTGEGNWDRDLDQPGEGNTLKRMPTGPTHFRVKLNFALLFVIY